MSTSPPIVQLRFTGLLVFSNNRPEDPMIIKPVKAPGHKLRTIWVRKNKENHSTVELIPLPENTGFKLTVTNPDAGHGMIEKYLGDVPSPDPQTQPAAYHHLLKFTDPERLPGNERAKPRGGKFHHDIDIKTGYFYSVDNYGVKMGPGDTCSNPQERTVSFMMGANLYFNPTKGGKASLTVAGSDPLETYLGTAEYIYEIHITNLPDVSHIKNGNHFRHYYRAFKDTAGNPHYVCPKKPLEIDVNYMHPCIPIGL